MTSLLPFIIWDVQPEIFPNSSIPLRWYGLLFAAAFFFGQMLILKIFKAEGKSEKDVDALTYYMIAATVIGARLGHCLFYQPDYYLANPIEIFKIWEGGLASHGATAGILVAMWLYSRNRPDQSWLWILDRIVIVVALGGSFIRMGNLMNSEIIGKPGHTPWSMVFVQPFTSVLKQMEGERIKEISFSKSGSDTLIDGIPAAALSMHLTFERDALPGTSAEAFLTSTMPHALETSNDEEKHLIAADSWEKARIGFDDQGLPTLQVRFFGILRHPAMVYESLSTFFLFVLLFSIWARHRRKLPEGRLFSLFLIVLFSLRFMYEFLKENQVDFESDLPLNMGQILSIPLVLFGFWLYFNPPKTKES